MGRPTNFIVEHTPNFCDGFESRRSEFDSDDELLAVEWVAVWAASDKHHRYSMSGDTLMVERDGGSWWWVLGRVKYPRRLGLPKWVAPAQERR